MIYTLPLIITIKNNQTQLHLKLLILKNMSSLFYYKARSHVANGRSCCWGVAVQCTRNSKPLTAFTPQRPLPSLAEGVHGLVLPMHLSVLCYLLSPPHKYHISINTSLLTFFVFVLFLTPLLQSTFLGVFPERTISSVLI